MWAKQSTAATLIVGPVLDSAGAEYTSAVIGDLSISKNGGTLTALAAAATLTHIANGQYTLVLTTGNLDTLGRTQITCNKSTYQMPPVNLQVVPANTYDAIVSGSDALTVDAIQISGNATAADNLELDYNGTGYAKPNSTIGTCTTNTDMRGTNNAALAATALSTSVWTSPPTGFLTATFPTVVPSAAQVNAEVDAALTDYDAPTKAEMDAGHAALPAALEAAILNEGDATALLAAIAAKVEEFLVNEGDATATIVAIATACNSAVESGAVGSNVASVKATVEATSTTVDSVASAVSTADGKLDTLLTRVTATVATLWANLVAMISGSGLTAAFTTTAMENALSGGGGGGDATEANQQAIITTLSTMPTDVSDRLERASGPLDKTMKYDDIVEYADADVGQTEVHRVVHNKIS